MWKCDIQICKWICWVHFCARTIVHFPLQLAGIFHAINNCYINLVLLSFITFFVSQWFVTIIKLHLKPLIIHESKISSVDSLPESIDWRASEERNYLPNSKIYLSQTTRKHYMIGYWEAIHQLLQIVSLFTLYCTLLTSYSNCLFYRTLWIKSEHGSSPAWA